MILNVNNSEPEKPNGDRGTPDREDEGVGVDDGDTALVVISPTAGGCDKPTFHFSQSFTFVSKPN